MPRTINVQVKDRDGFARIASQFIPAAERAVGLGADRVKTVAQTRVPLRDHDLQQSARVDVVRTGEGADATVGFYLVYARYQHENKLIHLNGRQDHYLSSAITDERANVYKIMAAQVKVILR